ncbi:hypothetical protein BGZ95_000089 [Linnemannia exigua]|uniref:Aquaporin n=1 Tax=Linnemannia exigua TaxID=604196 RepID=A0AAD4H4P4_9FUNG|nr:hypothetical protein BGZ95_000089 [Linnemannia exigua]
MSKSTAKGWFIQSLAEFIGTAMFMYLGVGGADAITNEIGEGNGGYLAKAFAFGIGLAITAWGFFRISGSHFNPAVSFSSLITGHLTVPKFVLYFVSQLLGAMLGVALARGTTPSSESIMQVNSLRNGQSLARGFFLEFFLTMILCFVYHMVVHEKNRSTFMSALPYGLTLFSCHLFATRYTNAAINPARAFATSVVARSFTSDHWIYWLGPLFGAILAAALHILFRYFDYDQHNAGIDAENQAQFLRAQAAAAQHLGHNYNGQQQTTYVNHNPNGTTTSTTTTTAPTSNGRH